MKTGLLALIHPYTLTEFLTLYSKGEPFVIDHTDLPIDALRNLPFLNSLDNLLKSWPHTIQAHLLDARDEISSIDTTTKDAQKLFDNGMGLLFNDAHTISPLLSEWVDKIKLELGLSMMTYGRCLIYATPDGKGTAPHFDQNINFVLQIRGTKIWTMAKNEFVENPLTRHTIGQMPDPELMSYLHEPMPEEMPKTARSYELKAGSLLFVPRGYWHATEAEGDALALNFTFTAPTWLDLFTAALRGRLAQSPEWRATADGVNSPERRKEAEAQFNHLLQDLVKDLPYWNAHDILEATDPFTT